VPGYEITFIIEDGSLSGQTGCNNYGASVVLSPPSFALTDFRRSTQRCGDPLDTIEARYLQAVESSRTAQVIDGRLILLGDQVSLSFDRASAPDFDAILDHIWQLDYVVESGDVRAASGNTAVLTLTTDGRISMVSPCRHYVGTFEVSDDRVTVPDLAVSGTCPKELAAQDDAVAVVLGDSFIVSLSQGSLVLTGPGGTQLALREEP
jgi:heat shock protein HslJ